MPLAGGKLPSWLVALLLGQFLVQVTVSLVRPVSSYRLLALGADATDVGLVAAAFALPPMLLAMSLGRWTDRSRPPGSVLVLGAALSALAALLLSRSGSVVEIGLWTGLLGIGHLCVVVGAQSLVAFTNPGGDGLAAFGLLTLVAALGQTVGPALGGFLSESSGTTPTPDSTSFSLGIAALIGMAAVPLGLATMRVPRGERSADDSSTEPADTARKLITTGGMLSALLASFGAKGSLDLITAYLPLLGTQIGLQPRTVGLLLSVSAAASILARLAMPALVRRARTERLLALTTAASAVCVLALPFGRDVSPLAVVMAVLGFLLALSQTVTMVWVVALVPPANSGAALGLRLTGNRVGQVTVPALAGLMAGPAGVRSTFYVLAGALGAIAVVVARSRAGRPR